MHAHTNSHSHFSYTPLSWLILSGFTKGGMWRRSTQEIDNFASMTNNGRKLIMEHKMRRQRPRWVAHTQPWTNDQQQAALSMRTKNKKLKTKSEKRKARKAKIRNEKRHRKRQRHIVLSIMKLKEGALNVPAEKVATRSWSPDWPLLLHSVFSSLAHSRLDASHCVACTGHQSMWCCHCKSVVASI